MYTIKKLDYRDQSKIKEFLAQEKAEGFEVRKIAPSLEDVFVSSIEEYDRSELKKN